MSITNLKKRYSYYKRLEETNGSLKEKQQIAFDAIKEQLGDDLPKERKTTKMTEEEKKAKRREYYLNHKEQIVNYAKTWNKNNKEKVSVYNKKAYQKKKAEGLKSEMKQNMASKSADDSVEEVINELTN